MKETILFISPEFFGYETRLKNRLENIGYDVTFFSDRPKLSTLGKGLMRLFPSIFKHKIDTYFENNILKACQKNQYDYVFVILGQSFDSNMFFKIRKTQERSKFILYLWDSIKNFPQCLELSKAFDKTITFDKNDAEKYDFIFLPLFFDIKTDNSSLVKDIDVSCVCTVKKGKYKELMQLKKCFENEFNCFFYFYLQSKLVYLYYKIFDKDFRKAKLSDFNFKRLSYSENIDILKRSKVVIDVQMKDQNGLTMRTFESLALKSKLVTTNSSISCYDFYDTQNIFIFNNNLDICKKFVLDKRPFNDNAIFEYKYSIDNWLNLVLGLKSK